LRALGDEEPGWRRSLARELAAGPEPERALHRAERVLDAAGEIPAGFEGADDALVRVLVASCATAPFLATSLVQNPGWLAALAREDLAAPLPPEALVERLAEARRAARAEDGDPSTALRRFKYYGLARITARDSALPLEHSAQTLTELSALADAILAEAERAARHELADSVGAPRFRDGSGVEHELGFCVLGLGKLGSSELNYSSDVDLVYVYESTPDGIARDGPGGLSPVEYFTRLGQRFGAIVTAPGAGGFLYRIDLDLRPEGAQSALVVSSDALGRYYEGWADTWEKAAFMKARPVAGDLELGWRCIRELAPLIYRSTMDFEGVRGIRRLKDRIEQEHGSETSGFDVKVGAGGIRDIEFVAQSLQLLHGGRMPQLRERSTLRTLDQLSALGLLDAKAQHELTESYLFLRRIENRLQMESERQTHKVPLAAEARERLARASGYSGDADSVLADFDRDLALHRGRTRSTFAGLLPDAPGERALDLLVRGAPALVALPTTRAMIEELAAQFGRALEHTASPERALNNLARFAESIGRHRSYYELLLDRPELVDRLVALFDASNYLSGLLSAHPALIEPVFSDPNVLLLEREELEADLASLHRELSEAFGDEQGGLDALRRFQRRQVINVGLLDVSERIDGLEVGEALTAIAEVCACGALELAEEQLAARRARLAAADSLHFLIVGMGKLGTHELGYGSDLDVIFLYDAEGAAPAARMEAGDHAVRLAQRWIGALQTTTGEGSCYEIDARLRPSGNQGVLVTSMQGFQDYHRGGDQGAQGWERQALLRARPIAGDAALAQRFEALRHEVLEQPIDDSLREEIHRIRMRMEDELARETHSRRDFKTGRGGVLDVESIVQYHQLLGVRDHPELCDTCPLALQLDRLEALGRLPTDDAETLRRGWVFLTDLSRRLRIVENRSISDLDEERGDLEGLALRMGYVSPGRGGGAKRALLAEYRRHTEAIRKIYLATFEA
jgi:glutamate-ammonia-ligase adenylyltransferase